MEQSRSEYDKKEDRMYGFRFKSFQPNDISETYSPKNEKIGSVSDGEFQVIDYTADLFVGLLYLYLSESIAL